MRRITRPSTSVVSCERIFLITVRDIEAMDEVVERREGSGDESSAVGLFNWERFGENAEVMKSE